MTPQELRIALAHAYSDHCQLTTLLSFYTWWREAHPGELGPLLRAGKLPFYPDTWRAQLFGPSLPAAQPGREVGHYQDAG